MGEPTTAVTKIYGAEVAFVEASDGGARVFLVLPAGIGSGEVSKLVSLACVSKEVYEEAVQRAEQTQEETAPFAGGLGVRVSKEVTW